MQTGTVTEKELNECLGALHRFALSLTKNEDRANDLVQDCVERCLRKQHLFDGRNLRSWMFTVCRRVFVNQIRRDKSRGISVDLDDAPSLFLSAGADQDIQLFYQDVVDNVERLPERDRDLLSLVALRGLKYEEIADELDLPVGTVRSRLSRARAKLRDSLEGGEQVMVH
jgi:RNA polymerase sigma-70 factor (ECF subfamily)